MGNVGEILEVFDNDNAYFDEYHDDPIDDGTYNATIVALSKRLDITTKNGDVCDIYYHQINP